MQLDTITRLLGDLVCAHITFGQIDGVEEDKLTKPTRPLPSGLISVEDARVLYRVSFFLMWAVSLYAGTKWCTLVYSIAILVYNEGGLVKYCVFKNGLGATGLACYCWGTTVILGRSPTRIQSPGGLIPPRSSPGADFLALQDQGRQLHGTKAIAAIMMGAIFATTVSTRRSIPHLQ